MTIDNNLINNYLELPKEERSKFIALNDCIYFGEKYIKPYDADWSSKTAPLHYELIDAILSYKNVQVHVPYDHAKTTWISIVFPIWQIVKDQNIQILLVGSTPKLVQKCLSAITWHLLYNPMIKRDFPGIKKNEEVEKWTDSQIYVKRDSVSKDPTIEVVGLGGDILGGRFRYILGDDVCNKKNMNTKNLRDKAEEIWLDDVHSRLLANGHIANIGTLQHHDDLGIRLSKHPKYHYIKKKAIISEETKETLWPERYDYDTLMEKKETIGTLRFLKVYQNEVSSTKGTLFDPKWLHYFEEDDVDYTNLRVYFGIDPDIADDEEYNRNDKNHCWFVIAVLGWDPDKNVIYVLRTYYGVHTFPEQVKIINREYGTWTPITMGVESNFYQLALKQQLFLDGLPAKKIVSKKNKIDRIESRSVDYETGRIMIRKNQLELIEEFVNFPDSNYKNDVLDAIDMGCRVIPVRRHARLVSGGVL